MARTRPVVIISLDELNARLKTITVCPLTSQLIRAGGQDSRSNCAEKQRKSPWIRSERSVRSAWVSGLPRYPTKMPLP
ncbi:MAG: type II toxin-antitoxin system PemK/MazF family toxin [Spirochaetes bacterium]|nr:type II toxin-antitoxin system PemK/MazF family toxin [Spirochaetota bacterium]